jgi:uncharacterized membrane protein
MSNKKLAKTVLYAYMILAPILVVYLLFFARMDFSLQALGISTVLGGFIVLWIINRLVK